MTEADNTPGALFRAGRLSEAIAAANAAVRSRPGDLGNRILLSELLLFDGNIERADVILDTAAKTDPSAAIVVAEFRQLLRAEAARRQYRREGRVPEFLGEPTAAMRAALAAGVALRAGDMAEAASHAAQIEDIRPRVPGVLVTENGEVAFDDFRDVDDLCAGFFEILTTTGKYYWVPTERVASLELHPPQRPRDLAWRRATISVNDGPDGEVYLPVMYDFEAPEMRDELRLGHATDWIGDEESGPVRGVGQRVFLVGDDDYGILALTTLRFGT